MPFNSHSISRCRPRWLTVLAVVVIAAIVALANFSFDQGVNGSIAHQSYGWPLIWHRYVAVGWNWGGYVTVGWYYSLSRLAANVAMWLFLLASTAVSCEWWLRRYRPKLRFSVRTLLAGVTISAAFCGWFAAARNRAALQDPLIAEMRGTWGIDHIGVERCGPKWLDLLGGDRYRRRIVTAYRVARFNESDPNSERFLGRLTRLPELRALTLAVDHLNPRMAAALNEMRNLQTLTLWRAPNEDKENVDASGARLPAIAGMARLEKLHLTNMTIGDESLAGLGNLQSLALSYVDPEYGAMGSESLAGLPSLKSLYLDGWRRDDDEPFWHDCLSAVGRASSLEDLQLTGMRIHAESLARLAALANLKSLSLAISAGVRPLLSHLPPLRRLESLCLDGSAFSDDDLPCLAVVPQLRLLTLDDTSVTPAGLAELASLDRLEELSLEGDLVSAEGLEAIPPLKSLRLLHLHPGASYGGSPRKECVLDDGATLSVLDDDLSGFRRAVEALRRSHPGIVVDGARAIISGDNYFGEFDLAEAAERKMTWLPASDWPWLNAAELADFASQGGWARFDAAHWKDKTVAF